MNVYYIIKSLPCVCYHSRRMYRDVRVRVQAHIILGPRYLHTDVTSWPEEMLSG